MKRLFFSFVITIMGITGIYAQTNLVATLSQGANIKTYYGADALSEAYAEAEDGDVITLSSGTFNAVNIEKAITIRGAGIYADNGINPTYLTGTFTITVPDQIGNNMSMESCRCLSVVEVIGNNLSSISFVKCYFENEVRCMRCSANFTSCVAYKLYSYNRDPNNHISGYFSTTVYCNSSILSNPEARGYYTGKDGEGTGRIEAENCLIINSNANLYYSSFVNCIFAFVYGEGQAYKLPSDCSAINCVSVNRSSNTDATETKEIFQNIVGNTNIYVESFTSIFETYTYDNCASGNPGRKGLPETERFELTDDAAATYLGDDGTQVGIYGGASPFNPIPTNPRVSKFVVQGETNDGKLNVKIDVE